MKLRLIALLIAVPAVVAGLLVVSDGAPAEAASYATRVSTRYVAINSDGNGKVSVRCTTSSTCRGTIYFGGTGNYRKSYSVPGRTTRYVTVKVRSGSVADPRNGTPSAGGYYSSAPRQNLYVNEDAPRNITVVNRVTPETLISSTRPRITGTVNGPAGMSDVEVQLIRELRGGNQEVVASRPISGSGDAYSFTSRLGINNTYGASYKLRIRGVDSQGKERRWYWRGQSGNTAGGSRYIYEANTVRTSKYGDFKANFYYGSISGSANAGTEVKVYAPPPSYSSSASKRREMDVPSCANLYGEFDVRGSSYIIPFLPYDGQGGNSLKGYMVNGRYQGSDVWFGQNAVAFGSCHDVLGYKFSSANLIDLSATPTSIDISGKVRPSGNDLPVKAYWSGFSATSSDRWVRLREMVPGVPILDAPVVAEGGVSSDQVKTFRDVPPGHYWVEVGRRTGCAAWYPSRYANNRAYFNGADRGAEGWKSFTTLSSLPGSSSTGLERIAISHGASQKYQGRRPSGYAGWMYREYCKAYGTGTINTVAVRGWDTNQALKKTTKNTKGAMVYGKVTRAGGKTNKEMMVRVSSVDGKRVLRTDYTDGGGRFYIAGLPSGNWTISVNSDSWRGIGRTFTGKHSVRVSAGHNYNVGTLRFKG